MLSREYTIVDLEQARILSNLLQRAEWVQLSINVEALGGKVVWYTAAERSQ
jgi:hypothetical protein